MTIRMKRQGQQPKPVTLKCAVHGNAYIYFDDIIIGGDPAHLAATLRELADKIEPKSLKGAQAQTWRPMPKAMETKETGWPWLVENYPQIFDGIDVTREPYAQYLKPSQNRTCDVCDGPVTGVTAKYCSAACRQAAYRRRRAA